jgi:hypothetical protein
MKEPFLVVGRRNGRLFRSSAGKMLAFIGDATLAFGRLLRGRAVSGAPICC